MTLQSVQLHRYTNFAVGLNVFLQCVITVLPGQYPRVGVCSGQHLDGSMEFRKWVQQANDMGLTEKAYILAGVTPIESGVVAKYMKNRVLGFDTHVRVFEFTPYPPYPAEQCHENHRHHTRTRRLQRHST